MAVVGQVQPGSPAANAGLEPRDAITQIDGQLVQADSALPEAIDAQKPGDPITLRLLGGGRAAEPRGHPR